MDLTNLLLPDGKFPLDVEGFGVWYSKRVLDGWVKQHSPACAAASVATAWNALLGFERNEEDALRQDDVVALLKECLESRIRRRTSKCVVFGCWDPLPSPSTARIQPERTGAPHLPRVFHPDRRT